MPRLMFAVFAERVSVDRFSNSADVLNIIEQLSVPTPPAPGVPPKETAGKSKNLLVARGQLKLFLHWRRKDPAVPEGTCRARIDFLRPTGKVLASAEQEFTLREHVYVRNIVGFDMFPIAGEGTYSARIFIRSGRRWRRVGETSFQLSYVKPAPEGSKVRVH